MRSFKENDRVQWTGLSLYSQENPEYAARHVGKKGRFVRHVTSQKGYGIIVSVWWDGDDDDTSVYETDIAHEVRQREPLGKQMMDARWGRAPVLS